MSTRPRRPLPGPFPTLLAALLLTACTRGPAPAPTPPGGSDAPPDQAAAHDQPGDQAEDACRDWSDLDVESLPPLPQTPYTATLEQAWRVVLDKHYDPTLSCQDWPAIRIEYGEKLTEAKDQKAAFALMGQMLGRLGQSHLALVPPRAEVSGEPRAAVKSGDDQAPLRVRVIGGKAVVVDPALGGHKSGIPGGAEVLAIDGQELAPVLADAAARHDREVEATFEVARTVASWLHCPKGAKKPIRYQALGAKKPKTRKVKCRAIETDKVTLGNLKDEPAVVDHRMLEGTTLGYVHFNIWMLPLMPKIEAALAELRGKGMTALVLDLRGNPGGLGAMVVPLGRQLLSEATDLGVMHMREGKQTFSVAAGQDPFEGPVVILIDEGTASTSEIFAQALKDLGRAKVYGAVPSQGAALPSVIEQLPGGAILQYVVADYKSPAGIAVEGKGVAPDTVVPETREDFAKGRDPVLDKAVADLGGTASP